MDFSSANAIWETTSANIPTCVLTNALAALKVLLRAAIWGAIWKIFMAWATKPSLWSFSALEDAAIKLMFRMSTCQKNYLATRWIMSSLLKFHFQSSSFVSSFKKIHSLWCAINKIKRAENFLQWTKFKIYLTSVLIIRKVNF